LFVEERPLTPGKMPNLHQVVSASSGAFATLGIPLVEGRTFEPTDPDRAPTEVIVSRSVALRYWADGHAVGKRVRMMPVGTWQTIVGVAGDVHGGGLDQPADETIYLPLVAARGDTAPGSRWTPREIALVVRGSGDLAQLGPSVERAIRTLDPAVPI